MEAGGDDDPYECLFGGLVNDQLNPFCAQQAFNLAKLVTSRPLDASFIIKDCADELNECRATCKTGEATADDKCAWRCLRQHVTGRATGGKSPSEQCTKAARRVLNLMGFDVRLNKKVANACMAEVSTLCQRPPGQMRVLACLKALGDDASEECQAAVEALPPLKTQLKSRFQKLVSIERARLRDRGMTTRGVLDLVELRGPVALMACGALFAVIVVGAYYSIYRYQRRGYTVFVGKE